MKKNLLGALFTIVSICVQAQTKGTNALGLGMSVSSIETVYPDNSLSKQKVGSYSLHYGNFIKDNLRLTVSGAFSRAESEHSTWGSSTVNGYSGGLSFQKYFPVLKKFFVYGGPGARYGYSETKNGGAGVEYEKTNDYSAGVFGGAAYFLNKRFAFEANLINANVSYVSSKGATSHGKTDRTNFNLSTSGALSGLGFQIYFLF